VSQSDGSKGHVARIDLISELDPFSRDSIAQLDNIQKAVKDLINQPASAGADDDRALHLLAGSTLYFTGTTASIRDLKNVTDQDQFRIDGLVLAVVFCILWALLRKATISAYLIVSVFFSYFVALGVTFVVFWSLDPSGFSGLDWKVPMFLFTILIAVGEDYNIFLMTRIEEEQAEFGPVEGVRVALLQTGGIISSCGIIMAGTFFSLVLAGSLVGMQQLGFALAFGVLLDTFVVRPILVPAYLIMLHGGRFGRMGKFLGSNSHQHAITFEKPEGLRPTG
jgi:RND superfamily putative drug exporter